MKQLAIICTAIILCMILIGLSQAAVDPEDFAGQWYASDHQRAYHFREGLIYSTKYGAALSATDSISGAYTYCKNSVVLFVMGIEGLEKEKELYLIQKGEGSFLCEKEDGSGKIYLIRYNE